MHNITQLHCISLCDQLGIVASLDRGMPTIHTKHHNITLVATKVYMILRSLQCQHGHVIKRELVSYVTSWNDTKVNNAITTT